ncbi:MAG: hypothetical protein H7263_18650 [Candidatus Sericytochromatia bacterium]|nr:hypothetical protein [Candidatus Sericytochromatia bacterium]
MLRKFVFVIILLSSIGVCAQSIQTYTAAQSPNLQQVNFVVTEDSSENQTEKFFGFLIAGVVLALGLAAFTVFAIQNKEVFKD